MDLLSKIWALQLLAYSKWPFSFTDEMMQITLTVLESTTDKLSFSLYPSIWTWYYCLHILLWNVHCNCLWWSLSVNRQYFFSIKCSKQKNKYLPIKHRSITESIIMLRKESLYYFEWIISTVCLLWPPCCHTVVLMLPFLSMYSHSSTCLPVE